MLQWKLDNSEEIIAYDGFMRPSSFAYIDKQGEYHIGYLSYENGIPGYFISDSNLENFYELGSLPFLVDSGEDIKLEINVSNHLHVHDDGIVMEFYIPVMRSLHNNPEQRVGLITVVDELGHAFAEEVSKQVGLNFMFSANNGNWISSNPDLQIDDKVNALFGANQLATNFDNWQWLSQEGHTYGIADYHLDDDNNVKFVFSVGAFELHSEFVFFQQAMILVLLVNIFFLLPLGFYFFNRTVLRPVAELVVGIESLSEGHYTQLREPSGKDELAFLTNSFNSMAYSIKSRETELQKLSLAVEQSPVSMIITNLKGDIEYVNPAFTRVTGYSFDEVLGKSTRILQGGETPAEVYQQLWENVTNGKQWRGIFHNRKKNGDLIWESARIIPIKDADEKIINYLALNEDITQRKLSEEQLHLQSVALQSAADSIVITDINGSMLWVNPAFEQLTGFSFEEAINKTPKILKSDRHDHAFYDHLWETILSGNTWSGEIYNKRKNGNIYLEHETITPVLDESGKIKHFVAIKRDITAYRQQEEQLRRSQKMDALGKLTGGIAHDFNNMLGVILGYAGLLEDRLDKQPDMSAYVHEISHAGERGAKLTKKLLSFSRYKSSEEDVLDLNALLQDEKNMLEKTLTARIKLVLDLSDDVCPIWSDSGDLEDAILNMSINAMHAIDGNGQLTISTTNEQINKLDANAIGLSAGNYVLLRFTDNGCGMDKETKEKIFDPFFTTKGEKGSGLGLSQVYGFVERSHGAVKVYSEPGQGTEFVIYFPRYQQSGHEIKSLEDNNVRDVQGSERILVVDDEPALQKLISKILSNNGYKVFISESAKQALDILKQENIDLLLSDVIMPDMDGYELAVIVQQNYPAIKIQLISGFSDDRHVKMVDNSLHKKLIYKPFNSNILLTRLRDLLDEKKLH